VILPSARAVRLAGLLLAASGLGIVVPVVGWACVGALVALLVAVAAEGARLPRDVFAVELLAPPRLSLGEKEPITLRLESRADVPLAVRVSLAAPTDMELTLAGAGELLLRPREAVDVPFTVVASRRGGRSLLPPLLRFGRPGGLAERQAETGEAVPLTVSPNVARLRRYDLLRHARALHSLGLHTLRYAGLGEEFDHLRAYTRGDDQRRIHWKATARRGMPITRMVRVERGQSVLLAVDVSHWMGVKAGTLSRLDHAVDAALFLAHVAQRAGDQVGLVLFAHEVVGFLPPSSGPGQIRRIVDALTRAEPLSVHPSYRNLARQLLKRRLRRSLVVVLTEPPDPESADDLLAAGTVLRRRHLPLPVSLRDPAVAAMAAAEPADADALCRRLAAREVEEERTQRMRAQRERGLQAVDALPGDLSVALVNRYLEFKGRGAL
jgi:uncharacterized protein (DUF58 family)